jgi:hypothetical protein
VGYYESNLFESLLDYQFDFYGNGLSGGLPDKSLLESLEDISMRRWHWMSLAFLAVALVRLWMYGRGRRMWLLSFLLLSAFHIAALAQNSVDLTVVFHNICPTNRSGSWSYQVQSFGCSGEDEGTVGLSYFIPAHSSISDLHVGVAGNQYTCSGSHAVLSVRVDGSVLTSWTLTDYTGMNVSKACYKTFDCGDPCKTNLSFTIKNNDVVSHNYYQSSDPHGAGLISGGLVLDPGKTGTSTVSWDCDDVPNVHFFQAPVGAKIMYPGTGGSWLDGTASTWFGDENGYLDPTQGGTQVDVQPSSAPDGTTPTPLPPVPVNSPPLNNYNPTNGLQSGTNSPILWSAGSGTNAALTAQQGFGALYDAMVKYGEQAHGDAGMIGSAVAGGSNAVVGIGTSLGTNISGLGKSITQTLSNLLAGLGTNGFSTNLFGTNIATETTLRGISNLWAIMATNGWGSNVFGTNLNKETTQVGVSNLLYGMGTNISDFLSWMRTNGTGTNAGLGDSTNFNNGVGTNFDFGGSTNWEGALAASAGPLNGIEAWFGNTLADMVLPTVAEGGECSGMVLIFPGTGYQIDFNPTHDHGYGSAFNIFYYAKMLIQWLICMYYVKRCLEDQQWAINLLGQQHGSINSGTWKKGSG